MGQLELPGAGRSANGRPRSASDAPEASGDFSVVALGRQGARGNQ